MSQYKSQIQNHFLSTARKKHIPVEVVLNTGTSLRGKIKGYDQFSITLNFKEKVEVIYKSSILFVTLLPKKRRPEPRREDEERPLGPSKSRLTISYDEFDDPPPPRKIPGRG